MSASVAEVSQPQAEPVSPAPAAQTLTFRSVAAGFVLAALLCAMNSYLTLSFGVIEEGPTIAALIFFACFFLSRTKISSHELVIVATMGSAGGSLGFVSNFFAAKFMVGGALTFWGMVSFIVVTSLVGLAFVPLLRELLIVRDKLPWPSSVATKSIIETLAERGDRRQPYYLLATFVACCGYVVLNSDGGFALVPESTELAIFGLAAYGAAIAWSPFAIGGAYLMGLRTSVGFLVGAIVLVVMARYLPADMQDAPHKFVWPGIGFLVAGGLTQLAINWKTIAAALRSLLSLGSASEEAAAEPIMSKRTYIAFAAVSLLATVLFLHIGWGLSVMLVIGLIVVGGLLQNIIATRAAAQTAFNPARVMGVLLQGFTAMCGAPAADATLTGAGMVAGSGAQAGNLAGDLAYGRWFKVRPGVQFWLQTATIIPCALIAAFVFGQIATAESLNFETGTLPAPVAKIWATSALIFEGKKPLPDFALEALLIGALIGVAYTLLEETKFKRWLPGSIGIGIGLILPIGYDLGFFLGGILLWVVLGRLLKWSEMTLTTIAVGSIVGEGIGGVAKPLLTLAGLIGD